MQPALACLLWPSLLAFPVLLSKTPFDWPQDKGARWDSVWTYLVHLWNSDSLSTSELPSPVGLCLGLASVVVGQILVILYFCAREFGFFGELKSIQFVSGKSGDNKKSMLARIKTHVFQPEGFFLLGETFVVSSSTTFSIMYRYYYYYY